jgi:hypothetical protein|tara:strand:- start:443 stop:607 length:165 start_codon:yes stop_codon:yes gene_type:complete
MPMQVNNYNTMGGAGPRRPFGPGSAMERLRPKSEMLPPGAQTENGNPHYATLGR